MSLYNLYSVICFLKAVIDHHLCSSHKTAPWAINFMVTIHCTSNLTMICYLLAAGKFMTTQSIDYPYHILQCFMQGRPLFITSAAAGCKHHHVVSIMLILNIIMILIIFIGDLFHVIYHKALQLFNYLIT